MSRVKEDYADHLNMMVDYEEHLDELRGPVSEEDLQRMYEQHVTAAVSGKARQS